MINGIYNQIFSTILVADMQKINKVIKTASIRCLKAEGTLCSRLRM